MFELIGRQQVELLALRQEIAELQKKLAQASLDKPKKRLEVPELPELAMSLGNGESD